MERKIALLKRIGLITAVCACLLVGVRAIGVFAVTGPSQESVPPRADIITIDGLKAFGTLERPPVQFQHDRHTEAVEKKGGDCSACHLKVENRMVIKYKRLEDTSKQATMDVYHVNCISCHTDRIKAGEKSGPITCGDCHTDQTRAVSTRKPFGMDRSLHYRHSKARENKCEACHHEYNEREKKLFWAEGKEGTCRYCHKQKTEENRISMRLASHQACIACHQQTLAAKKFAGPVKCGGCHDPLVQAAIEKVPDIPRMKRKQPDTVFVKTGLEGIPPEAKPAPRMGPVPFNHIGHEQYNDTCRVCHHAAMNACSECHKVTGAQEGKYVTLEQAMHQRRSEQSCQGCHQAKQADKTCAGCHGFIQGTEDRRPEMASCKNCHTDSLPRVESLGPGQPSALSPEMADELLKARRAVFHTFAVEDIPEKARIRKLSDRYEPAEFPHRKIVLKLFENIRQNKLAGYFHADEGTLCQGCHHNSPASKTPPACASCHGKPFDEMNVHRPGLMAAYHRQCMECHDAMGLKKPDSRDCTSCHVEKKR